MSDCKHQAFAADVDVNRLEDTGRFMADLRIRCADCGKPFQFLGLEPGLEMGGARCSMDGLEARLAIAPEGSEPSPLAELARQPGPRH